MNFRPPGRRRRLPSLLLALLMSAVGLAQTAEPRPSPEALVRKTVENELKAGNDAEAFMFKSRKETPHGSQTKLYVETRDAMAGLLIAVNDKPLTAKQRHAEEARLQRFLRDPEELRHKQKQEKEDSERVNRIVKALPAAFLYQYDGTEAGKPGIGKAGDKLVRLKFQPNPDYDPPSRVEQVLTGMQGYLLIDAHQDRMAKIDGTLFKDVGFVWGILGHLDRGGHFAVEQGDMGDGGWEITRISLSITGRILFFKSLNIKSDEVYSDFRRVPSNLTFAQGIELLKKQEAVLAENGSGHERADPK